MGSKPKFWYRPSDQEAPWLFKYPQAATGQHWAEKIAAEIANSLHIPHAVVELAEFGESQGSVSKSFARGGRHLVHGNELLAAFMPYDSKKRFGQSAHTPRQHPSVPSNGSFLSKSRRTGPRGSSPATSSSTRSSGTPTVITRIGDCWSSDEVGCSRIPGADLRSRLSLGRELRDEKREARLREGDHRPVFRKGPGWDLLGSRRTPWTQPARAGASGAVRKYPELFRPAILRVMRARRRPGRCDPEGA